MGANKNDWGTRGLAYIGAILSGGGICLLGYGVERLYRENWSWSQLTLLVFFASITAVLLSGLIGRAIDK